jgi:hypothetical protein
LYGVDLEKGGPCLCMIRSNNSFSYITISKVIEEVLEGTNVDSKPINFDNKERMDDNWRFILKEGV